MKQSFFDVAYKGVLLSLMLALTVEVKAQDATVRASEPYIPKPEIRFSITPVQHMPGETVVGATKPVVISVIPIETVVSIQKPVVVTQEPSIELEKDKRVDDQLRSYGKTSGWTLIWEAPEYVLDQNMIIQGDFETSITFFLKGANEAGSHLRAIFYRGNKTVRVTEY